MLISLDVQQRLKGCTRQKATMQPHQGGLLAGRKAGEWLRQLLKVGHYHILCTTKHTMLQMVGARMALQI